MASDSPTLKWSSCERSVAEVSIINDSRIKYPLTNSGSNLLPFDQHVRKEFPLCSSPPLKATPPLQDSPRFVLQNPAERLDKQVMDIFKTEFLSSILRQNVDQLAIFKSEFFALIRREQKDEIEDLKKQLSSLKNELSCILPKIKSECLAAIKEDRKKIVGLNHLCQKTDMGVQACFERKDQSIQTEDFILGKVQRNGDVFKDDSPMLRKNENNHVRQTKNDFEKQINHDRNIFNGKRGKNDDYENSESDEDVEHVSPLRGPPIQRVANCEVLDEDERYGVAVPGGRRGGMMEEQQYGVAMPGVRKGGLVEEQQYGVAMPGARRGGFARVQELRMTTANNNHQNYPVQSEPPCNDVSIATNAVLAKYLPPEKLAECQTPRRQNQQPAQDVVFNMTNVSFAMRYPAENDLSPEVGDYMYPPQNRHLKPSRFHDDRCHPEEFWDTRHPRRILEEDEWRMAGQREAMRRQPPVMERGWTHGRMGKEPLEAGYQGEQFHGRRDMREYQWGRGSPYRDNLGGRHGEHEAWDNERNYPMRGQPPVTNRILDITAIKNQPKLT